MSRRALELYSPLHFDACGVRNTHLQRNCFLMDSERQHFSFTITGTESISLFEGTGDQLTVNLKHNNSLTLSGTIRTKHNTVQIVKF